MSINKKKITIFSALILIFAGAFLFYKINKTRNIQVRETNILKNEQITELEEAAGTPEITNEESENSLAESEKTEKDDNKQAKTDDAPAEKKEEEKKEDESGSKDSDIINKLVSWGYEDASGRKIDTIIIHSSYNSLGGDEYSLSKILDIYKSYGVAAHYIIDRKGNIYRLVKDENIAYHAGESKVPDGRKGVNTFSIGIEMITDKEEGCTKDQYSSLKSLLAGLKGKYSIKYVLGHKDIAPGRKDDPWNFDWGKIK